MLLNEAIPDFRWILDHHNAALDNNRQLGQVHPQALVLIYIVHLYFHAAHRLRPAALLPLLQSLDSADEVNERMRER